MLRLALHTARHRVAALLAIGFATLGGAAMVTGIGVLAETGLRSHAPAGRLAGAAVVVSAPQTFQPEEDLPLALPERARLSADLVARVRGLPGVTSAAGDFSFPAAAGSGPEGTGHGWASLGLPGAGPGPAEIAVGEGMARPGDQVSVTAAGQRGTYRVSAVVAGPGIYFNDATAARLAGHGQVDLIAVRTAPGAEESVADAVRGLDPGLVVSTDAERGDAEDLGAAASRRLLPLLAASLAGVTLLVIGFIVGGALAVSVAAQRRELALMRAVGATPRQIRRLAAGQATVVAAVAMVPGVVAGYLLAEQFRGLLVSTGLLPSVLPLIVSPLPAVATLLLMFLVVQVAGRCAAWRVSHLPATEAVAESLSEPRNPSATRTRAGMALLVMANGVAIMPLLRQTQDGAAVTALAGILAAIGLGLAGPALIKKISGALARRLPSRASAATWLAVANSHGYALRVAGAVTTLAMVVVFTITYTFTQTTVLAASSESVFRADATVSAAGGLPGDALAAVEHTPGVLAAAPVSATTVLLGSKNIDSFSALILTPAASAIVNLDVHSGSLTDLTGDTIAADSDYSLGESVPLILGDGTHVTARVVATYASNLAAGPVILSRDLALRHTTGALDQSILVRTDGTSTARDTLAATHPHLTFGPAPSPTAKAAPELWINIAVLAVLIGYLLLGMANKLVAATTQRRTELATLRLSGATPKQLRAMIRREAALMSALAVLSGTLLSVIPIVLLSIGFLGRPYPAGPPWLVPAVALVVITLTFLATELPARQALRTHTLRET